MNNATTTIVIYMIGLGDRARARNAGARARVRGGGDRAAGDWGEPMRLRKGERARLRPNGDGTFEVETLIVSAPRVLITSDDPEERDGIVPLEFSKPMERRPPPPLHVVFGGRPLE